jgi:cystathionine gamma-synthase
MQKTSNRKLSLSTRVAQALHFLDDETGAPVPPIQLAATYARDESYEIRKPYWYRRDGNQTTDHAEAIIAELEGVPLTQATGCQLLCRWKPR